MPRRGKKYLEAFKGIDRDKKYFLEEALELVKRLKSAKFDETVEIAINLGVDPRHAEQMVRGSVVLPKGSGKDVRVLVFAKGEKVKEAQEAGANYVGGDDLVENIRAGWMEFDRAIATPDIMGMVGKLGKILGPRGLMPNPKSGTVTFDVARAVAEVKAGKIEFRVDRGGVVHAPFGKTSFSVEDLQENASALFEALFRLKPASSKGQYVRGAVVTSSMGPGIRLDPVQITNTFR